MTSPSARAVRASQARSRREDAAGDLECRAGRLMEAESLQDRSWPTNLNFAQIQPELQLPNILERERSISLRSDNAIRIEAVCLLKRNDGCPSTGSKNAVVRDPKLPLHRCHSSTC